jgi:hypothetical protein
MRRAIIAVLSFLIAACDDANPRGPTAVAEWLVEPEALLVIGVESRSGHELFRVMHGSRLSDGRIAVANSGTSEIRFYSTTGEHLGSAGREGRGPEEFRQIASVARTAGDTILVYTFDPALAVVSPGMRVVRKTPLEMSRMQVACRITESGVSLTPAGVFVIQAEDNPGNPGCPPNLGGVRQYTDLLARLDPTSGRFDTLGVFPSTDRDGPRYGAFGRMLAVTASTDRIFAGETGGDSISVFAINGEPLGVWHHSLQAVPLSEAAKSYVPQPRRMPDGSVVTPQPYTMPQTYPRFGRLLADLVGNLWVMAYPVLHEPISSWRLKSAAFHVVEEGGARWTVLDSQGNTIATVRTPPRMYALEIGADYVLGVAMDSLDVETVRLHRLVK